MIQPQRIHILNQAPFDGWAKYVLYWAEQAPRVRYNHALSYAIQRANELEVPLVCLVTLQKENRYTLRHASFLLGGFAQFQKDIQKLGASFLATFDAPGNAISKLAKQSVCVVTDATYLREGRTIRSEIARTLDKQFVEIETNIVVPVNIASQKREYTAATLRRKIQPQFAEFIKTVRTPRLKNQSPVTLKKSVDLNAQATAKKLASDLSVKPVDAFKPGATEAQKVLKKFIATKLASYENRNDPSLEIESDLSPYIHFGQISPADIALQINQTDFPQSVKDAFLEQLIVRRELAINYVYYTPSYDQFESLPPWAQKSLAEHTQDKREYLYTLGQLEQGATHDRYWNAAQTQLTAHGKMHNYMRMYWGKKILEWSKTPQHGFMISLYLNNKYELDGSDPNGFAGVAWCYGNHDRPWTRRKIFGQIRYMNANGLKRKFDIERYAKTWLGEEQTLPASDKLSV